MGLCFFCFCLFGFAFCFCFGAFAKGIFEDSFTAPSGFMWIFGSRSQFLQNIEHRLQEAAPYRWGTLLFKATPAELRPEKLREEAGCWWLSFFLWMGDGLRM